MARGGQNPTAVKASHLEVSCQHPRPGSPSSELPLPDTGLKSRSQLGSQPATLNEPTGLPDSPPTPGTLPFPCHLSKVENRGHTRRSASASQALALPPMSFLQTRHGRPKDKRASRWRGGSPADSSTNWLGLPHTSHGTPIVTHALCVGCDGVGCACHVSPPCFLTSPDAVLGRRADTHTAVSGKGASRSPPRRAG